MKMKNEVFFQIETFRSLCHELRRPLASIQAYAELLEDKISGPLTPEQSNDVATILRNTHRLSRLIQNLSDLGKLQTGAMSLKLEAVDVETILKQTCQDLEPFRRKEIWVHYEVDNGVQPVLGNRSRLLQVIENLLEHALQFTSEGGEICLRALPRKNGVVRIEVEDTGPDLESRGLKELFSGEQGYEESEKSLSCSGELLSLALSRQVMQLLGASMWAENRKEVGVRFCLEIQTAVTTAAP